MNSEQSMYAEEANALILKSDVEDGVDILNLSIGSNSSHVNERITFMNSFDAFLISDVKEVVFVVQAAGNGGLFTKSIVSYRPWITSVAAAVDDGRYNNSLFLADEKSLPGIGLALMYLILQLEF